MNGYLLSVLGTVLLCAVLTAIVPEGKTSATIKGIARLACVLAIVAPVLRFFKTGDVESIAIEKEENFFSQTGIDGEESYIKYYSDERIRNAEKALRAELKDKYEVETDVKVEYSLTVEDIYELYPSTKICVERIRIQTQSQVGEEVKRAMWLYVTENYCSEVLLE